MSHTPALSPPTVGNNLKADSRSRAWAMTGIVMILYMVNYGDKIVYGLIAQPLAEEVGLTSSQIGLVGSLFFLAYAIGGFFVGPINRWLSIRWALLLLALAWGFTMLPLAIWATFAVLVASRVLLGLTEGPASGLIHVAAYSWHPAEKRSLPGAIIASAAPIAKMCLAPAIAFTVATWGWRPAIIGMSTLGILWCCLWLFTWKDGPYGETRASKLDIKPTAASKISWRSVFITPTFLGGLAVVVPMYAVLSLIMTWLPSYFETALGLSRLQSGGLLAIPSAVSLIAMFGISYLSDRLVSRGASVRVLRGVVPASAVLLCGACLMVLPHAGSAALAVTVISIGYGFGTIAFPIVNSAISLLPPKTQLAGTLGTFIALMATGGVLAPYFAGALLDQAATPAAGFAMAFTIIGLVVSIGAIVGIFTINPVRDAQRLLDSIKHTTSKEN